MTLTLITQIDSVEIFRGVLMTLIAAVLIFRRRRKS